MTAFATLNGIRIASGRIAIPSYGAWTADLALASDLAIPTGQGACVLTAGDLTMTATAIRAGEYGGEPTARLVGGYGGWRTALKSPMAWHLSGGVPFSMVLGDVASAVGEKFSGASGGVGDHFAAPSGTLASLILHQLAAPFWYIAPSGVTQMGPRVAKVITSAFQVIDATPSSGRYVVAPQSVADWMPSNTFSAPAIGSPAPISFLEHVLEDSGELRTEILVQ